MRCIIHTRRLAVGPAQVGDWFAGAVLRDLGSLLASSGGARDVLVHVDMRLAKLQARARPLMYAYSPLSSRTSRRGHRRRQVEVESLRHEVATLRLAQQAPPRRAASAVAALAAAGLLVAAYVKLRRE